MNAEFTAILQKLVTEQGKDVLFNPSRFRPMIADYVRTEYKKESRLLAQAVEAGVAKAIDSTDEIEICKQQQARLLQEDYFLAQEIAVEVVDILELALRGTKTVIQPEQAPESLPPVTPPPASTTVEVPVYHTVFDYQQSAPPTSTTVVRPMLGQQATTGGIRWRRVLLLVGFISIMVLVINEYSSSSNVETPVTRNIPEAPVPKPPVPERDANGLTAADYDANGWAYKDGKWVASPKGARYQAPSYTVSITSIKIGNSSGGTWINKPGDKLYATAIRYIKPVITYDSYQNQNITFFVKIIDSSGNISRNNSTSPAGYTYSNSKYVVVGANQSLELSGWGNADKSSYSAGTWLVEVWHDGVCLASQPVTLY